MNQPSPAPDEFGALASLLGEPGKRLQYNTVLNAGRDALRLLSTELDSDWVRRHVTGDLIAELARNDPPPFPRRHPKRRDKHALYGEGLAPAYVALALEDFPVGTAPGWRTLQTLLVAGLLIRARDIKALGRNHLDALAQFLTGTHDEYQPLFRGPRDKYLSALGSEFAISHIKSQTLAFASNLPDSLVHAVGAVVRALAPFRAQRRQRNEHEPRPRSADPRRASPTRPSAITPLTDITVDEVRIVLGSVTQITPEQRRQATDDAESEAEQVAQAPAGMIDAEDATTNHQRAAHVRRSFLDIRQRLWARTQWDALAPGEMLGAMTYWLANAETALAANDVKVFESSLLVLLVGTTGWSPNTVWTTPLISAADDMPKGHSRAIVIEAGLITFPVPGESARYDPATRGHSAFVLPVSDQVQLDLPPSVAHLIQRYAASRASTGAIWLETEMPSLLDLIRSTQKEAREKEPRETLARIRNAHLLGLLCSSHDLPLAQLACGDLMGATDVGICYLSCHRSELQTLYNRVCETHGFDTSSALPDDTLAGGSRLQLPDSSVRAVSAHNRAGLGQPNGYRDASGPEIYRLHASYSAAVAWQLCAATAFRPGDSVGAVTIRQISLTGRCMVLAEKVLDEGHLGRLAPLCPLMVETLTAYGSHLEAMSVHPRLPTFARVAARAALTGQGPMFFMLVNGAAVPITGRMMRERLPRRWKLPSNAFRHRLSSKLRALGCPGVYVEALLGHVELGIQPFGRESFMDPAAFLKETSRCVQLLMEEDGWKPLYGLANDERSTWEPLSLGKWVLELHTRHAEAIENLRTTYRVDVDKFREMNAATVSKEVDAAIVTHSPDFFIHSGGRLEADTVRAIRLTATVNASSLAAIQITIEILRSAFTRTREERGWKIARMPYFYRGKVEASPFSPDFPCAYETFLRLRSHFVDSLNSHRKAMGHLSLTARLSLALILWHGVADWPRLENILRNLHRGRHIQGLGDAIAIPYEIPNGDEAFESTEVLRGAVAMAAAPCVLEGQPITIGKAELGNLLSRCIPSWVTLESGAKLMDILLATTRLAHLFEHPSPLRDIWNGTISSVSPPFARIERLFATTAPPSTNMAPEPIQTDDENDGAREGRDAKAPPTSVFAEYKRLRPILRVPRGRAKLLPHSKTVLPLGTPTKTMRREILRELQWHSDHRENPTSLSGLLSSYALALLTKGTRSSHTIEPQTVYNYVVGAGSALLRVHADADLLSMESEELLALYGDAVEATRSPYRPSVATYLSYFHDYLVHDQGAAAVDLRGIGGTFTGIPDVGWVAPREFTRSHELLALPATSESVGSILSYRQSSHVLDLGYATGARSAEIVMREQRELVIDPSRSMLHVRANRMTRVKTKRATRLIPLAGWMPTSQLEAITGLAAANEACKPSHALFPSEEDPRTPADPDLIARHLGHALRAATGESRARQYWLRHTAASQEFLALFGDEHLLGSLASHAPDTVPFPFGLSATSFAELLGGHAVLSPIHAAAYRARRGHASVETSLTTYVHAAALIEPMASREAPTQLTHHGFATLLGRSPSSIRQILHRAKTSASDIRGVRRVLVSASSGSVSISAPTVSPDAPYVASTPKLRLRSIVRGVRTYLHTGDEGEAIRHMNGASRAEAIAREVFRGLTFRPSSSSSPIAVKAPRSLLTPRPAAGAPSWFVSSKNISSNIIQSALERMRPQGGQRDPLDARLWELVLDGIAAPYGVIRFRNIDDLECVTSGLTEALAIEKDPGNYVLQVDAQAEETLIERDLRAHPAFRNCTIVRCNLTTALAGYLPVAMTYQTQGGHDRTTTLVLLAIAWRIWRQTLQTGFAETADPPTA